MTSYHLGGTDLTELTAPAPDDRLQALDKSDTITAPADADGSSKWASFLTVAKSVGFLAKAVKTLTPSGDTSGAADVTAINNVIANGDACELAWTGTDWGGGQTPFYVGSPLLPATGSILRGQQPWHSSESDNYGAGAGTSGGTVIAAVGTFSGAAAIDLVNTSGTQMHGITLANFAIDGISAMPAGHGIRVHGAFGACIIEGVCVNGPFADCLHYEADSGVSLGPDDFRVAFSKFGGSFTGYGIWGDNIPDSWFIGCECSGNALDGWRLGHSPNTRLVAGCKGENNGGAGLHLAGQAGSGRALQVSDFTTHQNAGDGILCDNSASGSAGGVYLLSNCVLIGDGTGGGTTFAGIRANGSVNKIQGSNILSTGAPNGASQASSSAGMDFVHSSFSGTSKNVVDDGSNTTPLVSRQSPDSPRATLRTAFTQASSTSAQNVTGLAVPLAVGTYKVTLWAPMKQSAGTGTEKFGFTFGGTASAVWGKWFATQGTTQTNTLITTITTQTASTAALSSGALLFAEFTGEITVSAAGTLQFQVQASATGNQVIFPVGSYLDAELLA